MNNSAQSDPLRDKASALCAHLEVLCASGVCAVRSGDLETLNKLESRKSIVLQELVRMLKLPPLSQSPDFVRLIVERAGAAIRAELDAVTAVAGQIRIKLSLLRARAQDLSKLRASYGNADSSAQSRVSMTLSSIIARG
jgi:hypothetical protein